MARIQRIVPWILLAVLAGAPAVGSAQEVWESYRAYGANPSWSLTISNGRILFERAGGAPVSVAAPAPEGDEVNRFFRTRRLRVDILVGASCREEATGRRYADTVVVTVRGREFGGCGGDILAPGDITDTSWAFVEIAGAAIEPTISNYSLDIGPRGPGGIGGYLGYSACNRFGGTFTRSGDILTFGPISATRARCRPPHDEHERRLFQMLSGPVEIAFDGPDMLILTGSGTTARLRRTRTGYEP